MAPRLTRCICVTRVTRATSIVKTKARPRQTDNTSIRDTSSSELKAPAPSRRLSLPEGLATALSAALNTPPAPVSSPSPPEPSPSTPTPPDGDESDIRIDPERFCYPSLDDPTLPQRTRTHTHTHTHRLKSRRERYDGRLGSRAHASEHSSKCSNS